MAWHARTVESCHTCKVVTKFQSASAFEPMLRAMSSARLQVLSQPVIDSVFRFATIMIFFLSALQAAGQKWSVNLAQVTA